MHQNHFQIIGLILLQLGIINQRGQQSLYTLASGITPAWCGTYRKFQRSWVTVDLVARSLRKLGKKVRFIYSWDNFDTFRKVPKIFQILKRWKNI